jgi:guanyl-specific ribonuclease Sa
MDQKLPANGSADVARMLDGWSKWLVLVVMLILAGCGAGPSPSTPVPETKPSAVIAPDLGESIRFTPDSKRHEESMGADSSVVDSPPRETITPGKNGSKRPAPDGKNSKTRSESSAGLSKNTSTIGTRISNVTLHNEARRVIYSGPIDLQPTLDRIKAGTRNQHRNDGAVFQNREGILPRKRTGYYHEYVVPTPRESGPGPQRLIVGSSGEVYYTSDHYKSFQRVKTK